MYTFIYRKRHFKFAHLAINPFTINGGLSSGSTIWGIFKQIPVIKTASKVKVQYFNDENYATTVTL